jgi:tRNA dimethylallyltransferase
MEGLNDMPGANAVIRAVIQTEAEKLGWPAIHALLSQVDPHTAARLAPADSQRISRALEVFRISGKPLSSFHQINLAPTQASASKPSNSAALQWANVPLLSLEPKDRSWLHKRIEQRFDDMLSHGFLDEVKVLRARGDLTPDLPAMRCVGYRQAWEALDGTLPMSELRDRGVFATRQLAKRQITWLRSLPQRTVLEADGEAVLKQALQWVESRMFVA